jgi:hypothetical protein
MDKEVAKAKEAWKTVRPLEEQIIRHMADAPITDRERMMMALYACSSFFGTAAGFMKAAIPDLHDAPLSVIAGSVMEIVVTMMEHTEAGIEH